MVEPKVKLDINVLGGAIGKLSEAITAVTNALVKWVSSQDIRRMRKCIRLGDKIVRRANELNIDDKYLENYCDKWDKYNN